ncbi:endolytic transglycosylase MltG [Nocardia yamanashiensis]|uniref:endolytic transglycosylase MltG n=1 Tax=Nocardia yamanashiensis TaxID=209247 RepID=UPI000837136D
MNNYDKHNDQEPGADDIARMRELIGKSSLGDALAQVMRAQIPVERGQNLVSEADGIEPAPTLVEFPDHTAGEQVSSPQEPFDGPRSSPRLDRRYRNLVLATAAAVVLVLTLGVGILTGVTMRQQPIATDLATVVISEGRQLHDQVDVSTGARKDGIYRRIAEASCASVVPAAKCLTYEQFEAAGTNTDPVALGVPDWALGWVRSVPDRTRQLEGLIGAGSWTFDPTESPDQILKQLVTESTATYESAGILGNSTGLTPYDTLIAASVLEREALSQDMPKVARVILNRLRANRPLEFDSTVIYGRGNTETATTDADRARKTPWNTYAMTGLPATPISAPSPEALRAMVNPATGPWLYFVTIDKQGTTLFTDDYDQHLRNIEKARQSGISPGN